MHQRGKTDRNVVILYKYDDAISLYSTLPLFLCVVILLFISKISHRLFGFFSPSILLSLFLLCATLSLYHFRIFFSSILMHHRYSRLFSWHNSGGCRHRGRCEKLSLAIMLNKTKILKYTCNKFNVKSKSVCCNPCTFHAQTHTFIEWWRNFLLHCSFGSVKQTEIEKKWKEKKTSQKNLVLTLHFKRTTPRNKHNQIWQMVRRTKGRGRERASEHGTERTNKRTQHNEVTNKKTEIGPTKEKKMPWRMWASTNPYLFVSIYSLLVSKQVGINVAVDATKRIHKKVSSTFVMLIRKRSYFQH